MTVLVINPNSNEAVTRGLRDSLMSFPGVECVTLTSGPFGIESQCDIDRVVQPILKLLQSRPDAGAFVLACYSDPGLEAAREICKQPVFGIQESGLATALCRADMFGVIALSQASILRHRTYMRRMGVLERLAGERAVNMSVDASARGDDTFDRLRDVGQEIINDGAQCLILGCAGMARHRTALEADLGVPVIDPTQAAVSMALGTIWSSSL